MRRILLGLAFLLGFTGVAAAYDSPKALVEAIYAPYRTGGEHTDLGPFYSERLKGIIAANIAKQQSTDVVGVPVSPATPDLLQFNPFIGGENALLLDLVIAEPVVVGDRAVVSVSFYNFDHTALLSLALVRENGGWLVDDVASLGASEKYLLSWLAEYDPFGIN
ncbi:MAG: hypothetical protein ACO1OG_12695 [Devosia sp.]